MRRRRSWVICAQALTLIAVLGSSAAVAAGEPDGSPAAGGQPLIVGGGPATASGWEFVAGLKLRKSSFICGGAVIAPTRVLTAAHCVKGIKRRKLVAAVGSPWLSGPRAGPRIPVVRVRVHPDYNGRKVIHDLAVLTLRRPVAVTPIELPTAREAKAATKPGNTVRVAGWGARSAWGFRISRRLKSARQRTHRAKNCRRAYGKAGFRGSSMICALGGLVRRFRGHLNFRATDCFGDSGGPLVAGTPAGPRLVGIVSAGVFPCGLGGPSIYSRVSESLPFIRRVSAVP
jgi:secreted trypsin-like serine protease